MMGFSRGVSTEYSTAMTIRTSGSNLATRYEIYTKEAEIYEIHTTIRWDTQVAATLSCCAVFIFLIALPIQIYEIKMRRNVLRIAMRAIVREKMLFLVVSIQARLTTEE